MIGRPGAGRAGPLAGLVLGVVLGHLWLLQQAPPLRTARPPAPVMLVRGVVAPLALAQPQPQAHGPGAPKRPPRAQRAAATARQMPAPGRAAPAAQPAVAAPPAPASSPSGPHGQALPVYATRLPPPLQWAYRFTRGAAVGTAVLHWRPDGQHYGASFAGEAGGVPVFEWSSSGAFDAAGVAPERFVDRRGGRGAQAANFRRETGRISYSGPSVEWPLVAGAQDRLSWMPQLAGIVAAAPERWGAGQEIALFVSGARGDADVWRFRVEGPETLDGMPGAPVAALKLQRDPPRPYDIRAEVWLDPARHHMPVRARLRNGAVVWVFELQHE